MWPCCLNTIWQLQLASDGPAQDFAYLASFICWISFMCSICLEMEVGRRWSCGTSVLLMGTLSLPKMFGKLFRLPMLKGFLLCFCPILRSFVVFMKFLTSLVRCKITKDVQDAYIILSSRLPCIFCGFLTAIVHVLWYQTLSVLLSGQGRNYSGR